MSNENVFDFIGSPLKAMSIVDAGGGFPIANIPGSVELLWLNNLRCELDCAMLASLPRLREVNLLNSRKIANIEALLESRTLESVQFINCGKPFTRELKQRFQAKDYKRLQIEFA